MTSTNEHSAPATAEATITKPPFDPVMHQPPRLDVFGFNHFPKVRMCDDGTNILRDKTKINLPPQWVDPQATTTLEEANGKSKVRTVTELV